MISAIVDAAGGKLAPTLASLVPAAADGLVREVLVADPNASREVAAVAEDAGARLVVAGEESFPRACAQAGQIWVLALQAGARLESGWGEAAWRHINDHADQAGWFQLSLRGDWLRATAQEAAAAVAAGWFGRLRAEHGLLIPRRLLDEARERGVTLRLPIRIGRGGLAPIAARILVEL